MKTAGKVVLGIFIGIVLIFVGIIGLGVLIDMGVLKSSPDEPPEIRVEYKPQNISEPIDEDSIPDSEYYPSPEQAMKNSSFQADPEEVYQKSMDEVIAKFENENYASVYFKSIKDKNTGCLTFAKFKKKVIDGEERYTFITRFPSDLTKNSWKVGTLESLIEGQLSLSDFTQSVNINPENTRFVWGDCDSKEIYKLKVEGQKPTSIIAYDIFDEKRYFWYYENLESDIAGSQLQFTLD